MKKVRLFIGIITAMLSIVVITEFLFDIMWGLLSMEAPGLNAIQVIVVFITLLMSGVISAIYNDTNSIWFRFVQFTFYLAGTGIVISIFSAEEIICNVVKIWMSIASVVMLLVLIFDRERNTLLQDSPTGLS